MENLIAEQWIKGSTADPRWIGQNKHGVIFTTLGGNDESNAQRLVKCWNEYDSLKAKADVCDELVEIIQKFIKGHESGTTIPAIWLTEKAKQALAKAERSK